jgi:ribosomal protein S18 acetylase RimI-like enzyme
MTYLAIECRRLSLEWKQSLAAFFQELQEAGDAKYFHPHPLTYEEAERRCQYEGDDIYYVLVEGNRVLGYGMLRGWDEGYNVPSLGIALHPSIRGIGVGEMFVRFLHVAARRKGARKVRLKVYRDNVAAIKLYKKVGYSFQTDERGQLIGCVDL